MDTDRRNEIAASVAAQQHLGPGYEQALAEGLVERISTEIDDRITRQIDQRVSAEVDDQVAAGLNQHLGCRHARRALRASRRASAAQSGRPSVILILGSFVFAMSSTAIVLAKSSSSVYTNGGGSQSGPGAAGVILTALIWIVIGLVNVAYVTGRTGSRRDSG